MELYGLVFGFHPFCPEKHPPLTQMGKHGGSPIPDPNGWDLYGKYLINDSCVFIHTYYVIISELESQRF